MKKLPANLRMKDDQVGPLGIAAYMVQNDRETSQATYCATSDRKSKRTAFNNKYDYFLYLLGSCL
jgi:hypothetical protein